MTREGIKNFLYGLVFGSLFGYVTAFGAGVLIPRFYPEVAGKMVCEGRLEYLSFKQAYFCVSAANDFVNIQDAMFWAIFWRAIWIAIPVCLLATYAFMWLAAVLYRRRMEAGF